MVITEYVGPKWLPRRSVTVTTIKGRAVTTTLSLSRWGRPVTITLPAASDVDTGLSQLT